MPLGTVIVTMVSVRSQAKAQRCLATSASRAGIRSTTWNVLLAAKSGHGLPVPIPRAPLGAEPVSGFAVASRHERALRSSAWSCWSKADPLGGCPGCYCLCKRICCIRKSPPLRKTCLVICICDASKWTISRKLASGQSRCVAQGACSRQLDCGTRAGPQTLPGSEPQQLADQAIDLRAPNGSMTTIAVEAQASFQPRDAERLLIGFGRTLRKLAVNAPLLVVAPWLSPRLRNSWLPTTSISSISPGMPSSSSTTRRSTSARRAPGAIPNQLRADARRSEGQRLRVSFGSWRTSRRHTASPRLPKRQS